MTLTRRLLLGGLGAAIGAGAARAEAPSVSGPRTRAILLGTKGGPTLSAVRAAPATLIQAGGANYLVDCGNGVGVQLAKAGVALTAVRRILITHNHSDHIADVATLPMLAWDSGPMKPIDIYGPPPLEQIVHGSFQAFRYDLEVRRREEGLPPLEPLVRVHELARPGRVFRDENVTVTAALVDHYTVKPAFAYRFDAADRSIVVSGDTTYSETLIRLAQGADVLIHEAMYEPAIIELAAGNPALLEHLRKAHTTTEQLGLVAARAGVKKLVLTHLVPAWPKITDEMWLEGVRKHYSGEAVVGRDLMVV